MTPATRRLAAALLGAGLALLGGCAVLPRDVDRPSSQRLVADGTSTLARIAAADSPPAGLSGFRLLPSAGFALGARLDLARKAERSLDVQSFLIDDDSTGRLFLRTLAEAAARGVRVRLLVDDLYAGGHDELFAGFAALENVEVRVFNPLPARGGGVLSRFARSLPELNRVNRRMHNKLLVADGALALFGGRNIGDEYFLADRAANFIDLDAVATGAIVERLATAFDAYWNSEQAWPIEALAPPADRQARQRQFSTRVLGAAAGASDTGRDPLGETSLGAQLAAGRLRQTVASAEAHIDAPRKAAGRTSRSDSAMARVLEVIAEATSEVVIVSPYFIPGAVGMPMMRAARERGRRVVLYTNSLGSTDEPLVHDRYARYRREMLQMGVEIREISATRARDSGSFGDLGTTIARLHAKAAVIDRRRVYIGSVNLSGRSSLYNTELGVVIESERLAGQLLSLLEKDANRSMLQVRLAADGQSLRWVTVDGDGRETESSEEPGDSWWHRLRRWLLSPLDEGWF